MKENKEIIYVCLMSTDDEIWRPVIAERINNSYFKIVSENDNPDDEKWQFKTSDVVRCSVRTPFDCTHSDCLVAVEKITSR